MLDVSDYIIAICNKCQEEWNSLNKIEDKLTTSKQDPVSVLETVEPVQEPVQEPNITSPKKVQKKTKLKIVG